MKLRTEYFVNCLLFPFFTDKGLEDSMRRNAVRSIGVEACLFEQKELEQLYAVFKVSPYEWS